MRTIILPVKATRHYEDNNITSKILYNTMACYTIIHLFVTQYMMVTLKAK